MIVKPSLLLGNICRLRVFSAFKQKRANKFAIFVFTGQFAATGNPNGPGVPAWAPYDAGRDNYLTFGGDMTEGSGWRTKSLDFIERFYAARA